MTDRLEELLTAILAELRLIASGQERLAKGQEEIRALLIHRKKGALRQEKYVTKRQDDAPTPPARTAPAPQINGTTREHTVTRQDDGQHRSVPAGGPAPPPLRHDDVPLTPDRHDDARGVGGDSSSALSDPEKQQLQLQHPQTPSRQDDAAQVFAFWVQHMGKRADVVFHGKRERLVRARLRDRYTVEQLCQAIRGCKLSPHHRGENDSGAVYDDLELICRNASKVDFFIAIAERPARSNLRSGAAQIAMSPEARVEHDVPGKKWVGTRT